MAQGGHYDLAQRGHYVVAQGGHYAWIFHNMTDEEKLIILNFLWDNWESLTERSIRLIEKMAIIKNEYPDTYEMVWGIDFLK